MAVESANQLNRELLRWIQSLDLAYAIKHVKRDFANGFLVAEILSRYYDKDVSMHSYDNGIGVRVKKDNWDQLLRLFARLPDLEPLLVRADIDAIIHCQNGAAVAFLSKLYQCLTKRTIQPTVVPQPSAVAPADASSAVASKARDATMLPEEIPPYAKPTGSALIREKMMRDPAIAAIDDETEINRKVRSIHSQHEETLQLDRLLTDASERYPSLRSASKASVLRGATKPVRNDQNPVLAPNQVVKEVQIKPMNEKSLEKLRVTREAKENESLGAGSLGSGLAGSGGLAFEGRGRGLAGAGAMGGSMSGELVQKRRPMDLLNEVVTRKLASMGLPPLEQRGKDNFEVFVDAVQDGRKLSDRVCADMLLDVADDSTHTLALACLQFPQEFWKIAGLLFPLLLTHDDESAVFQATVELFVQLGRQCVQRDGASAMLLVIESLLPKITANLRSYASKRAHLLRVLYAFVPDTELAHLQTIKRLREAMPDDIALFTHAVSILIYMETALDDTLADLYHYYCCIGLETSCEKLRAACLSMLVPLARFDLSLVIDLLPRLTQFSSRFAWWEVKAQLLIVASAFLALAASQQDTERDLTEQIELALTIIEREFHPIASLNVRRVGLSYLAKTLSNYQELVPLYVDVLFSVPPTVRQIMLMPSGGSNTHESPAVEAYEATQDAVTADELPIRGTSGARYVLMLLPGQWDSTAIAKQIFYEWKTHESSENTAEILDVLLRCFDQLLSAGDSDSVWMLFVQMRELLALGLLNAGSCGVSVQLIECALTAVGSSSLPANLDTELFQHDSFIDAVQKLVSKNVDDIRQQAVVKLLHEASRRDRATELSVQRCVQTLRSACDPPTFSASLFAKVLDAGL